MHGQQNKNFVAELY